MVVEEYVKRLLGAGGVLLLEMAAEEALGITIFS